MVTKLKVALSLAFLLMTYAISFAQTTIADGLPGCLGIPIKASVNCNGSSFYFDINAAGQFEANNASGQGCCGVNQGSNDSYFQFDQVNISSFTNVTISIDYSASDGGSTEYEDFSSTPVFGCSTAMINSGHDQIIFSYSVNGGPFNFVAATDYIHGTDQSAFTGSWASPPINGNTVTFRVYASNKSNDENFYFENLIIQGTPRVVSAGPDKSTCNNGTVNLMGTGAGMWTGGTGTFSNMSSATSTYTAGNGDNNSVVTLTYSGKPGTPGCADSYPPSTDDMDLTIEAPSAELSGFGSLCPGECSDPIVVDFDGGAAPFTLNLTFTPPGFPITIPGFNVNDVITVCHGTSGIIPSYNASTKTLTLPTSLVAGQSASLVLTSFTDANGCAGTIIGGDVDIQFFRKPVAMATTLEACDLGNGIGAFDLVGASATILNGIGGFVNFYTDNTLTTEVTDNPYLSVPTTLYAVVTDNNDCTATPVQIPLVLGTNGNVGVITVGCQVGIAGCLLCNNGNIQDAVLNFSFVDPTKTYIVTLAIQTGSSTVTITRTLTPGNYQITLPVSATTTFVVTSVQADGDCIDNTGMPPPIIYTFVNPPSITGPSTLQDCNPIVLPPLSGTNLTGSGYYSSNPDGTGTTYAVGSIISTSAVLYAIDGIVPDCYNSLLVNVVIGGSITMIPPLNDTFCGSYTLPLPPVPTAAYFTMPNGLGIRLDGGSVMFVSDTLYLFNTNTACVSNNPSFYIHIIDSLRFDSLEVIEGCEYIVLDTITGVGVTDSASYYTLANGGGTRYFAGDTIRTTDTLYLFDPTVNCDQDSFSVVLSIGGPTTYDEPTSFDVCGLFVLPTITGINVRPTARYFTAPNGGGTSYSSGDTISTSTLLYVFDTTQNCNVNQPFFRVDISPEAMFAYPDTVYECTSFVLPPLSGNNIDPTAIYSSTAVSPGVSLPIGSSISSSRMIYLISGGNCPVLDSFYVLISPLLPGTPDNFGICGENSLNLFDGLIAPYTPDGTWQESSGLFDVTNPSAVPISNSIPRGTYTFRYTVGSANCSAQSAILQVAISPQPVLRSDTTLIICSGSLSTLNYNTIHGNNLELYSYSSSPFLPILGGSTNLIGIDTGLYIVSVQGSNNLLIPALDGSVVCLDSMKISLDLIAPPTAGADVVINICQGNMVDLRESLSGGAMGGQFYLGVDPTPISPLINTNSLQIGTVTYRYVVNPTPACQADSAFIIINVFKVNQAGLDSTIVRCSFTPTKLTPFLRNADAGGRFAVISGGYTLSNDTLYINSTGTARIAYITKNNGPCNEDTSFLTIITSPTIQTSFMDRTCNLSYTVGGKTFTQQNSTGTLLLKNSEGCDSVVSVAITFLQPTSSNVTRQVCRGDTLIINGKPYFQGRLTGRDTIRNSAANGCDSILNITVTLRDTQVVSRSFTSCDPNFSISVGSTIFNAQNSSGRVVLTNTAGCDSTVNVNVQISPLDVTIEISDPLCEDEEGQFTVTDIGTASAIELDYGGTKVNLRRNDVPASYISATGPQTIRFKDNANMCEDSVQLNFIKAQLFTGMIVATPLTDSTWQLAFDPEDAITTYFWTSSSNSLSCWDCPNPIVSKPDNIGLIYDYGELCTGFDNIVLEKTINTKVVFPNIISGIKGTPNGTLTITVPDGATMIVEEFNVFDRWGNNMASLKNITASNSLDLWDGTQNGTPVVSGVYVYSIRYSLGGKKVTKSGDVTVLK